MSKDDSRPYFVTYEQWLTMTKMPELFPGIEKDPRFEDYRKRRELEELRERVELQSQLKELEEFERRELRRRQILTRRPEHLKWETIPQRQEIILVLRQEGYTNKQIEFVTGIPIGTIENDVKALKDDGLL